VSDRLAKQVADKLRAIDEWGSRGDVMSVRNALPALARLVEACGKVAASREPIYSVGDCVCQYGEREHSSSDCPLAAAEDAEGEAVKEIKDALRDVAASLGVTE